MAQPKYRRRKSFARPGIAEGSPTVSGSRSGAANGPETLTPVSPEVQVAEPDVPGSPRRGIVRESKKRLAIIRGSSALGAELRLREHLRQQMLGDVMDFLRTLMDAGAENPEKLGHLGFEAAKLIVDKLTGFPQHPYDETEALGIALVGHDTVEEEAARVVKQLQSQPLDRYLAIAERGALPPGEQKPDDHRPE